MALESTQLPYSKELEFLNHESGHPGDVSGITSKPHLGESLAVTRMQHKRKSEMNTFRDNKIAKLDLSPIVYITTQNIGGQLPTRPMVVLLDSGSSHTMMKQSSLPHGAIPMLGRPKRTTTTNGVFSTSSFIKLQQIKFPEFGNQCIAEARADIFESPTC